MHLIDRHHGQPDQGDGMMVAVDVEWTKNSRTKGQNIPFCNRS